MMRIDRPPRYRTGTAELAPFWRAQYLYRHDPWDGELIACEWGPLGLEGTADQLLRAGFTCYRAVPACPDWLLRTVPGLGDVRIAALRRILPYSRDIYAGPLCPGRVMENARAMERLGTPAIDAFLAEQVRRQVDGEPELLCTDAVLAGLAERTDGGA
jgi:hypothetical protein